MVENGCDTAVMEVSSQGLMQSRVEGIHFNISAFTNIEKDHISPTEHKDFEDYFYWKKQLFYRTDVGIFNADDVRLDALDKTQFPIQIKTFGIKEGVDYQATEIEVTTFNEDIVVTIDWVTVIGAVECLYTISKRTITATWNEETRTIEALSNCVAGEEAEVLAGITYSGNTETEEGTHTATATLPANSNYQFASGSSTTFSYTIDPVVEPDTDEEV